MSKPNSTKKIFSVASKYEKVLDILNEVPNQSEYICQAILEKYNGIAKSEEVSTEKIDERIKAILADMMTGHVLIATLGQELPVAQIPQTQQYVPEPPKEKAVHKPSAEVKTDNETDEETTNLIKGVLSSW